MLVKQCEFAARSITEQGVYPHTAGVVFGGAERWTRARLAHDYRIGTVLHGLMLDALHIIVRGIVQSSQFHRLQIGRWSMLHLPSSQLRFLRLLLLGLCCRRPLHHLARLCRRLCEVVLEFGRAALQARDRPANVVITDGVRQAITIRDDCTTHKIN